MSETTRVAPGGPSDPMHPNPVDVAKLEAAGRNGFVVTQDETGAAEILIPGHRLTKPMMQQISDSARGTDVVADGAYLKVQAGAKGAEAISGMLQEAGLTPASGGAAPQQEATPRA